MARTQAALAELFTTAPRRDPRAQILTELLDPDWRPDEWDPASQVFCPRPEHPLNPVVWCRVEGCRSTCNRLAIELCRSCRRRWDEAGQPDLEAWLAGAKPSSRTETVPGRCLLEVDGVACPRPHDGGSELCQTHEMRWRRWRARGQDFEAFAAGAGHLADLGSCVVASCSLPAESVEQRLCHGHYRSWAGAGRPRDRAFVDWAACAPPRKSGRTVVLAGLPPLVVTEVLYALQARDRAGTVTRPAHVHPVIKLLRARQPVSVTDLGLAGIEEGLSSAPRAFARFVFDVVTLAYANPEVERKKDRWDLRVLGHRSAVHLDFSRLTQPWLAQLAKEWAWLASPRLSAGYLHSAVRDLALVSEVLLARPGGARDRSRLGRPDVEALIVGLDREVLRGAITPRRRRTVIITTKVVIDDARRAGLLEGVTGTFAVHRRDIPVLACPEERPGLSLPACVVAQLSTCEALSHLAAIPLTNRGGLGDHAGIQLVLTFEVLRDTGRRIGEVASLRWDCLDADGEGRPVLVYDNRKGGRLGRHLPISEDLHAKIAAQQAWVLTAFPNTPKDRLVLFPRVTKNPAGTQSVGTETLDRQLRGWVDDLEVLDGPERAPDGQAIPFDRALIHPHAFRHTFAQRHADAGTPVEVLQELMDHTSLATTQGYFRISMERKRAAADRVSRFRQDRYGQPVHLGRPGADSDQTAGLRTGIAMVAVPFGLCAEPSNVTAGGGACPIRYRCTACPHFSCDPSFLPELRAHLDELVRAREAGLAMGADEWALAPAAEITAFRGLIHSLEEQLASLGADERTAIDIASTELRRARQAMPVSFGKRPGEERGSHG